VLFCDYGLSGPPVLQVSRLAEGGNATISLDIIPDMTEAEIKSEILRRTELFKDRPVSELLTGFIHKRLGQVLLKTAGADVNASVSTLDEKVVGKAAKMMKDWRFKVTGTTGFENAQVTAGGAQVAQFFDNLMSKKAKGLFAIGEVLNVDGDCGGFNLAFAWSSAFAAANGVADFLNGDNK
jgi:predicted Rossmann fold flavoprotein